MTLEFSQHVESDLRDLCRHIEKSSPESAIRVLRRIYDEIEQIAATPLLYRQRHELRGSPRMGIVGQYVILFTLRGRMIRIERVVHGMRDLGTLLD